MSEQLRILPIQCLVVPFVKDEVVEARGESAEDVGLQK
jgi:hypothetical protein